MPLFELDEGRLVPAQYGRPVNEPIEPDAVDVVREQLLEIVARPLFPVRRLRGFGAADGSESEPGTAPTGGAPREADLIALDSDGQVVVVAVTARVDAATLVWILAQAGKGARMSWTDIAQGYPGGVATFRSEWAGFRESAPRGVQGPPAVLVAFAIDDDVRPALEVLASSGLQVIELVVRRMSSGRRFVDAVELRRTALPSARPVITPSSPRRMVGAAGGRGEPEAVTPTVSVDLSPEGNLRMIGAVLSSAVELVWRDGAGDDHVHSALLTPDGVIVLPGGLSVTDPTDAARRVSGRDDVDGWSAWRVGDGGPTLGEARAELQGAVGRRHGGGGSRAAGSDGRRRRHATAV